MNSLLPESDFFDWFLKWLDLGGECEQARGRMVDDDIIVEVMLERSSQGAQRSPCAREPTVVK